MARFWCQVFLTEPYSAGLKEKKISRRDVQMDTKIKMGWVTGDH